MNANKDKVPVIAKKAITQDLSATSADPKRQTNWTDDYITESGFDLYAFHTREGELVALGAYKLDENSVVVHIIYMESQAESNKTLVSTPKYLGISRALVAFGIKLSVDAGHNGDVTLDAKTPELAVHYERDFEELTRLNYDREMAKLNDSTTPIRGFFDAVPACPTS